jgi:predicted RNA binding protein YcfA (HicA-like mRNA interferase family)
MCFNIDKYNNMCYYYIVRRVNYMKSYSSREVIAILEADGWYEVGVTGSHHQYKHPTKKGRTTVKHPDKDIPLPTLKSIERQSGLKFK